MRSIEAKDLTKFLIEKDLFIFDFDGTIADTEPLHWQAFNQCLASYNVHLTEGHIKRYIGNKEHVIHGMIRDDFGIQFSDEEFSSVRIATYINLVGECGLTPYSYFFDVIKTFPASKLVILSSSKLWIINKLLEIWGMEDVFDEIISVSDSHIEKIDVYKDTKKYFNIEQSKAVLFEDANKYLKMGRANNILSVGIESNYNIGELKDCDLKLSLPK